MDLTTDIGFANAMFSVCNLKPGSGALAAPVCGSWIFMTGGIKFCLLLYKLNMLNTSCFQVKHVSIWGPGAWAPLGARTSHQWAIPISLQ